MSQVGKSNDRSIRNERCQLLLCRNPHHRVALGDDNHGGDGDGTDAVAGVEPPDRIRCLVIQVRIAGKQRVPHPCLVLGTDEETRDGSLLSTERARNLSQWLRRSLGSGTTVIPVDAGRYRGATAPPEDQVGRLIVAAVSVLDPGADLAAALRNALAENEESPLNVRLYSRFEPVTAEGDTASR